MGLVDVYESINGAEKTAFLKSLVGRVARSAPKPPPGYKPPKARPKAQPAGGSKSQAKVVERGGDAGRQGASAATRRAAASQGFEAFNRSAARQMQRKAGSIEELLTLIKEGAITLSQVEEAVKQLMKSKGPGVAPARAARTKLRTPITGSPSGRFTLRERARTGVIGKPVTRPPAKPVTNVMKPPKKTSEMFKGQSFEEDPYVRVMETLFGKEAAARFKRLIPRKGTGTFGRGADMGKGRFKRLKPGEKAPGKQVEEKVVAASVDVDKVAAAAYAEAKTLLSTARRAVASLKQAKVRPIQPPMSIVPKKIKL